MPYVIWFGPYKDRCVEELILTVKGLEYLLKQKSPERLAKRIREVMKRSAGFRHDCRCSCCGEQANYIKHYGDKSGYTFQELFCESCKPEAFGKERYISLSLDGVMAVSGNARRELMGFLRRRVFKAPSYCSGRQAHEIFFPEEAAKLAAEKAAAKVEPKQQSLF